MKKILLTILIPFFALPIMWAENYYYEIKQEYTVSKIEKELQKIITDANVNGIIFVTGSKTDANTTLSLYISTGKTVVWNAYYHYTSSGGYANYLMKIHGDGTFNVAEGTLVSVNATAIKEENYIFGSNRMTVIVSGNGKIEVSGNGANAINALGKIEIKDNAYLNSTTGETIKSDNFYEKVIIRVTGGTILATSENAIFTKGDSAEIFISGGYIANDATGNYPTVYAQGSQSIVHVSGIGIVEAKGKGNAIFSQGYVKVTGNAQVNANKGGYEGNAAVGSYLGVEISDNAKVCAKNTFAIYDQYGFCSITINGGAVFAYGKNISDVINNSLLLPQEISGVVLAWDKDAGNTVYERNSTNDLIVYPEEVATAYWDRKEGKNGISYTNSTNTGFISIDGITIDGVSIAETYGCTSLQVYPNPTTRELKIENGELKIMNMEIFDVYGRVILHSPFSILNSIDISHLQAGVYFIKIHSDKGIVTKKVIKN